MAGVEMFKLNHLLFSISLKKKISIVGRANSRGSCPADATASTSATAKDPTFHPQQIQITEFIRIQN
jgi:hypothetical protein